MLDKNTLVSIYKNNDSSFNGKGIITACKTQKAIEIYQKVSLDAKKSAINLLDTLTRLEIFGQLKRVHIYTDLLMPVSGDQTNVILLGELVETLQNFIKMKDVNKLPAENVLYVWVGGDVLKTEVMKHMNKAVTKGAKEMPVESVSVLTRIQNVKRKLTRSVSKMNACNVEVQKADVLKILSEIDPDNAASDQICFDGKTAYLNIGIVASSKELESLYLLEQLNQVLETYNNIKYVSDFNLDCIKIQSPMSNKLLANSMSLPDFIEKVYSISMFGDIIKPVAKSKSISTAMDNVAVVPKAKAAVALKDIDYDLAKFATAYASAVGLSTTMVVDFNGTKIKLDASKLESHYLLNTVILNDPILFGVLTELFGKETMGKELKEFYFNTHDFYIKACAVPNSKYIFNKTMYVAKAILKQIS